MNAQSCDQPDLPIPCFVISTTTHCNDVTRARLVAEAITGLKIGSCRTFEGCEYMVMSVGFYKKPAGWFFYFVLKNTLPYWEEISSEAETKNTKGGGGPDRQ